jgi:site-specific DNA-cytosine methylase
MPRLSAVGNYIFAGGFTLGVEQHFKVLAHLEDGLFGVNTFRLNRPRVPIFADRATWPAADYKGVDLLYCNPPCAPWSAAGLSMMHGGSNWKTDPRTSCVRHAHELALSIQPRVWLWESVVRAFSCGRELVDELTRDWIRRGYSVTYLFTDLAHHGAAQYRKRFFFIAHKYELEFRWPEDMHIITCAEVIGRKGLKLSYVCEVPKKWLDWLPRAKPGEALSQVWMRIYPKRAARIETRENGRTYVPGRPHLLAHRIRPDRPIGTVTSVTAHIHYKEQRFLGHEELLLLGGWPIDWKFSGSKGMWQSEIAKAVQPPAAEYVAANVARSLRRNIRIREPRVQIIDTRSPYEHEQL